MFVGFFDIDVELLRSIVSSIFIFQSISTFGDFAYSTPHLMFYLKHFFDDFLRIRITTFFNDTCILIFNFRSSTL